MRNLRGELVAAFRDSAVRRGVVGAALLPAACLSASYPSPMTPPQIAAKTILGVGATEFLAVTLLLVGVAILVDSWLRLRWRVADGTVAARAVMVVWSLPLLIVPPLFSSDAYAYGAQGNLLAQGISPYQYGPSASRDGFVQWVDPLWRGTPAPYGPLALQISRLIVILSGNNPQVSSILMRLPALAGIALMIWGLRRLAVALDRDPEVVLWWGVLNPLVIMHFVGGVHNDVLMLGGGIAALALATRGRLVFAGIVLGAAALIKQPILVLLPVLVVLAPSPRKITKWVTAAVMSVGAFIVGSYATGLGFGWIHAAGVPSTVGSLSPSNNIGKFLGALAMTAGAPQEYLPLIIKITSAIVLAGALAVGLWMVAKMMRDSSYVTTYLCWGLLLLGAALPAVQAWYLLWGAAFLGFVSLTVLQERAVMTTVLFLVGYSVVDSVFRIGVSSLVLLAATGILAFSLAGDRIARFLPELAAIVPVPRAAIAVTARRGLAGAPSPEMVTASRSS